MGRSKRRLGLLSVLCLYALAACDEIDREVPPVWTPFEVVDGTFHPDFEQAPGAAAAPARLRVVTYNVYRGVDVVEDIAFFLTNPDLAAADVIALQEATRPLDDGSSDASQLARALQMGHVFVPTFEWKGRLHGIALLSRFPLVDIQVMRLPEQSDLDTREQASRAALRATIETVAGPLDIINVHLDPPLNMPERILQLRPAVIDARAPVAVLGDYNTNDYVWVGETVPLLPLDAVANTSQAPELDHYMQRIGYATPTSRFGPTWHGFPEDQRLDSIFTKQLLTGRGNVERDLETSDHWPVWLDVSVRP